MDVPVLKIQTDHLAEDDTNHVEDETDKQDSEDGDAEVPVGGAPGVVVNVEVSQVVGRHVVQLQGEGSG